jgi:hypothetical protein
VEKAKAVLASVSGKTKSVPREHHNAPVQASLFDDKNSEIIDEILKIDPNRLTPLDALNFLQKLRDKISKGDYH